MSTTDKTGRTSNSPPLMPPGPADPPQDRGRDNTLSQNRAADISRHVSHDDPSDASSTAQTVHPAPPLSKNQISKVQAFDDAARDQTKSAFDTLFAVWRNAKDSYGRQVRFQESDKDKRDPEIHHSLKVFKQGRDHDWHASHEDGSFASAYNKLKESYRRANSESPMEQWLPKDSRFRTSLYPYNGAVRNVRTGLYADLRDNPNGRKGKDYFLCFPGTGAAGNAARQWNDNIDQAKGKHPVPQTYTEALELASELKAEIEKNGGTLTVIGYSLGGGQANYCGMMLDLPSVCFNAAPLGQACRENIQPMLDDESVLNKQTHVRVKADQVSSEKNHQKLLLAQQLTGDTKIARARHYGIVHVLMPDHPDYPTYPASKFYKRHDLGALEPAYIIKGSRTKNNPSSNSSNSSMQTKSTAASATASTTASTIVATTSNTEYTGITTTQAAPTARQNDSEDRSVLVSVSDTSANDESQDEIKTDSRVSSASSGVGSDDRSI